MVNPASELYEKHPDWVMHAGNYPRTEQRNQLLLNLALPDVQQYIISALSDILTKTPQIEYIKWDFNRGLHEYEGASTPHRYVLGSYAVLDALTKKFPHILFEGCASGGGRFDAGMLYYFPQSWTSDNTDAVDRLSIQFGTSMVFPASSMGGHVSAVPNHQNNRVTPFLFRAHVAMMCGSFGFELDLAKLPPADLKLAEYVVTLSKQVQHLVHHGDMYRLDGDSNTPACLFVSKDRAEAVLFYFQISANVLRDTHAFKLRGLDEAADYTVQGCSSTGEGPSQLYGGAELRYRGLVVPCRGQGLGDHQSRVYRLQVAKQDGARGQ